MVDPTYQPKIYRKQGGAELVAALGGKVNMEPGSALIRSILEKSASYTVLPSESGTIIYAKAVDLVFTLPAVADGLWYTFVVHTVSASTGLLISPQAADAIMGGGLTSVDDEDLKNTAATDAEGDMVTLEAGPDGWWITSIFGTWAKV